MYLSHFNEPMYRLDSPPPIRHPDYYGGDCLLHMVEVGNEFHNVWAQVVPRSLAPALLQAFSRLNRFHHLLCAIVSEYACVNRTAISTNAQVRSTAAQAPSDECQQEDSCTRDPGVRSASGVDPQTLTPAVKAIPLSVPP